MVVLYISFAIFATLINLIFQFLSLEVYSGYAGLYLAMVVGTAAGLLTKYYLDKRWIFKYKHKSIKDNATKLVLYTFMGGITTFIFWGTELAFDYYMNSEAAKYIGAVLGLSIGYIVKYFLDKKYVFVQ